MDQNGADGHRDKDRPGHVDPFESGPPRQGGGPAPQHPSDHASHLPDVLELSGEVAFLAAHAALRVRQAQVRVAWGYLSRQIVPGDITQRPRRACLHALRFPRAEMAFSRLPGFRIVGKHLPGADPEAYLAARALLRIDKPGVVDGGKDDGVFRADVGAGNGVGALPAEVLDDEAVTVVALPGAPGRDAPGAEIEISVDSDAGDRRRRLSVVELRAGELAATAPDA